MKVMELKIQTSIESGWRIRDEKETKSVDAWPGTVYSQLQTRAPNSDSWLSDQRQIVLEWARREQENTYPEFVGSGRCKLVVLVIETVDVQVLRQLSHAKTREVPSFMRVPAALMWERRWTRLLAVTCAKSFAVSVGDPASHVIWCHTGGEAPVLADLFEADPR